MGSLSTFAARCPNGSEADKPVEFAYAVPVALLSAMMSWLACLQHSATDKLGRPVSARAVVSYTTPRDIIAVSLTSSSITSEVLSRYSRIDTVAHGVGGAAERSKLLVS